MTYDPRALDGKHLDALRETANIGAGHAATALSSMTNRRVMVNVPEVSIQPIEDVGSMLGDPEQIVAAVVVAVAGEVDGRTLQVFEGRTSARLVSLLMNGREPEFPGGFGALEKSAVMEIGNILVGAYVNALADLTRMRITMTVPAFAIDMAGAILMTSHLNFGTEGDHVLSIGTQLSVDGMEDLRAHFLFIPEEDSLDRILKVLRVA